MVGWDCVVCGLLYAIAWICLLFRCWFAYCGLCWLLWFCVFVVFLSSVCCEFGVWLVVLAVDGCLLGG